MIAARSCRRPGAIAAMVALLLTAMMGVVVLTVEGGLLMTKKREVQAVADGAAMAAAIVLYENYPSQGGLGPQSTAKQAAWDVASANGYDHTASNCSVTVNFPPNITGSSIYNDTTKFPGCVEVIITYNQPRSFSNIWGSGDLPVKARAVGRGAWTAYNAGIIVLAYSGKKTLNIMGNGAFAASNAPVIVDSNDPSAAYDGGNGTTKAPEYDITGGDAGKTTQFENTSGVYDASIIHTGVHPTPDPLAYLPVPDHPSAGTITSSKVGGTTYYTLTPGAFGGSGEPKLPNFTNKDVVTFTQGGIYYLTSGGLNANGATLQMGSTPASGPGGIMIYNAGTGSSDGINIAGDPSGTVNLSGMTSGIYKNLIFFQSRSASEDVQIAGNGTFNITGTFYASDATLKVTGNGSVSNIGSQYVSLDLTLAGNGNVNISWAGDKVAPTRILCLVE